MAGMSSVVQQVSESLSEGVSKFTLFVVKAKKANAPLQAELGNTIHGIARQCSQLAAMGTQIAQDYEEYEEIRAQIEGDSVALNSASKNFTSTADSIDRSADGEERRDSWQRIADGCATMAEKVIAILKTLFQAELDRLFAVAEKAIRMLRETEAQTKDGVVADEQAYADHVSATATQCAQLAQYMQSKSETEDTESMQQDMVETASSLQNGANQLINDVNQSLQDLFDEPEPLAPTIATATAQREAIERIVQKLREQQEFKRAMAVQPDPVSNYGDSSMDSAEPEPLEPPAPAAVVEEQRAPEPVQQQAPVAATPAPTPTPVATKKPGQKASDRPANWKATNISDVVDYAQNVADDAQGNSLLAASCNKLLELIRRLAQAAEKGDSADMLQAAREIADLTNQFSQDIKQAATGATNPRHKDRLILCSACLRDSCKQLKIIASVKAASGDENLDKDMQLISLTSNLVRMWKETSDNVEISRLDKTRIKI